jgi:hypothetical protein
LRNPWDKWDKNVFIPFIPRIVLFIAQRMNAVSLGRMSLIAALDLSLNDFGGNLVGLCPGFDGYHSPLLEVVIPSAPGDHYRAGVKQGSLYRHHIPTILIFCGLDMAE